MTRRRTTEGGCTTALRKPRGSVLALALAAGFLVVTASLTLPAVAGTKEQLDDAKRELAKVQAELTAATAEWQGAERDLELTRHEVTLTRAAIGRL